MWKRDNKIEMQGKVPVAILHVGQPKEVFISRPTLLIIPGALSLETAEQSRWGLCPQVRRPQWLMQEAFCWLHRLSQPCRKGASDSGSVLICVATAATAAAESGASSLGPRSTMFNPVCKFAEWKDSRKCTLLFSIYHFINTKEWTQKQLCADFIVG